MDITVNSAEIAGGKASNVVVAIKDFFANNFFATSFAASSESFDPTLLITATFCSFKQFY